MSDSREASFRFTLRGIGDRARSLRLVQNLSQAELGTRSGVAVSTIRRFEQTSRASLETVLRIAYALGAEKGFGVLFEPPRFSSLTQALAQAKIVTRKRARGRR